MTTPEAIRTQILALVKDYHEAKFANKSFDPDKDLVHYAGKKIKGTLPFFRLLSAMPAGLPRTVFDDIPHHVFQRQIKG